MNGIRRAGLLRNPSGRLIGAEVSSCRRQDEPKRATYGIGPVVVVVRTEREPEVRGKSLAEV